MEPLALLMEPPEVIISVPELTATLPPSVLVPVSTSVPAPDLVMPPAPVNGALIVAVTPGSVTIVTLPVACKEKRLPASRLTT